MLEANINGQNHSSSIVSSVKIDGKGTDLLVLTKVLFWEDEYLLRQEKVNSSLIQQNEYLIDCYHNKAKINCPVKMPTTRNLRITLPETPKRPKGKMPISIPRLLKTPDADELRFVPHFDSLNGYRQFEEKLPELEDVYKKITLKSYMKRKHKQVIPETSFNDYLMMKFMQTFGPDSGKLKSLAAILNKNINSIEMYLENLQERLKKRNEEKEKEDGQKTAIGVIGKCNKKYFCNICYVYCCNLHMNCTEDGVKKTSLDLENKEWPVVRISAPTGKLMKLGDVLKNRRFVLHRSKSEASKCYCYYSKKGKSFCFRSTNKDLAPPPLTQPQLHLLLELLKLTVPNPCLLSYLIGDSTKCLSIHNYLNDNTYLLQNQHSPPILVPLEEIKPLYGAQYFYHFTPGSREYTPCNHPGLCSSDNCPCVKSRGFCEKFCMCRNYCARQFAGCDCKSGDACSQRQCKCFANSRECDPDLCACCAKCANMAITLNHHKKVLLGNSMVCDGYGLFAGEDIGKGEYICEYLGELISRGEGERRGIINDLIGSTYLFDLTEETLIDAVTIGSKMRYANHASHGMENSIAKILYVNGISRIGLYSLRPIKKNEEILFNYRIKKKLEWVEGYKARYKLTDKTVAPSGFDIC